MNIKHLITTAIAISTLCNCALAVENCKDPQTQYAMNNCATIDYKQEDFKLNENFKKFMSKLDSEQKNKFSSVQKAWIKFRDLQCEFSSSQYKGGTIYPLIYSSCLTEVTKQRNVDIKSLMEEPAL